MRVAIFNAKPYEREVFIQANAEVHELVFLETHLSEATALLAEGFPAICAFVNDDLSAPVLERLAEKGVRYIALRSAGFNHIDLQAAERLNLTVARVPAYSPYAVAEHTVGLMLTLNRKLHRAHQRVREGNFALGGLIGFDFHGKSAGVIGTGKIGRIVAQILQGFGMTVFASDTYQDPECLARGIKYVPLAEPFSASDIVTLHCPLTPDTHHLINADTLQQMRDGAMLINTSRGGLIDTAAIVEALKQGKIGYLGLDVYEEEGDLFFEDLSDTIIQDDTFTRLLTFPNVLITAHQAFFTREALTNIIETTLTNISGFVDGTVPEQNLVSARLLSSR